MHTAAAAIAPWFARGHVHGQAARQMPPANLNTEAQLHTADMQEIAKLVGGTVAQAATMAAFFYGIDQVRIHTGTSQPFSLHRHTHTPLPLAQS